ncbi:MAG: hypothetical protein GY708_25760, partial [Actinomycetia bacterium]|nr:hypothetical protein [Actinomycetes bacterium]
ITATVGGETVTGGGASDDLLIVAAPGIEKQFVGDPVNPGDTVTLVFTLTYPEESPGDATGISFSDDLEATLSGLVAVGLPANDVCGVGSQITGTSNLMLTGGTLVPGDSCSISVTLQVPGTAAPGSYTNTTSNVVATVLGVPATRNAASDDLTIAGLTLTKEFIDDPVLPGGSVTLEFTLDNMSPTEDATGILFTDNLGGILSGLQSTSGTLTDVCGVGSQITGTTFLVFTGGSVPAATSCTFSVTVQVPASAVADTYLNQTSNVTATQGGSTLTFDPASAPLVVETNFLSLTKEFTDDPVSPGDTVTLRFTLSNLNATEAASNIAFTDDLDAALSGLEATGLPAAACGGTVSGTSTISFSGGTLAGGASCSFDVTLSVPSEIVLGAAVTNVTSEVTGTIGGLGVTGGVASDTLLIDTLLFSKAFDGPTTAGGSAVLTFTIENLTPAESALDLSFFDDLDAVLSGLVATGLPVSDVCGAGSILTGTSQLVFTNGSVLPGGSCTFAVTVQVPATAEPGDYLNKTSELRQGQLPATKPASATLTVSASVPVPPGFADAVVVALNSAHMRQGSDVISGDFVVNDAASGPTLTSGQELTLGLSTTTPAGFAVKADRLKVKSSAIVSGDALCNDLTDNSGSVTCDPLPLPVFPFLPPFFEADLGPGVQDVTVNIGESLQLAPGDYGDILVKKNGVLTFTGGIYNVRSLNGGVSVELLFDAASEVRIEGKFDTDQNSIVGPADGSGLAASDIIFYVAGINGNNGNLGATPKAAQIGLNNVVDANFYVPYGTLFLRKNSDAAGAFIGLDVTVGEGVQVWLDSFFATEP